MAWTVQRQAHFCAVNAHSPNKRICAKYADQNALADKCYGIGYIVWLAFSSFVFFFASPNNVVAICICIGSVCVYMHCMQLTTQTFILIKYLIRRDM